MTQHQASLRSELRVDIREAIRACESTRAMEQASLLKVLGYLIFKPGVHAVVLYRVSRWLLKHRLTPAAYFVSLISSCLTGSDISPRSEFGPGLVVVHPAGVVVTGLVRGGRQVRLTSCCGLGSQAGGVNQDGRAPTLGDDVLIGAGAKIIGPRRLGDGARIGANAVVTCDVPAFHTAMGIPARCAPRKSSQASQAAGSNPTSPGAGSVVRPFGVAERQTLVG